MTKDFMDGASQCQHMKYSGEFSPNRCTTKCKTKFNGKIITEIKLLLAHIYELLNMRFMNERKNGASTEKMY